MSKLTPFSHQAEAFKVIALQKQAIYMIAGTAAGKTLAVALPIFHLLQIGQMKRVLFMYPTLALLEDQERVMKKLAKQTGMKVAYIRGGMNRQELIQALNCPVILATPDAVYWFFQKNIKFSSLLIYGLAKVDAFVIDEAHLFQGLVLRNLALFKQRVQLLAEKIGKQQVWHVLTATPNEALRMLTTNGVCVNGRSKCGHVGLELLPIREKRFEAREAMIAKAGELLAQGAKRILIVFNSAASAHQAFQKFKKEVKLPAQLEQKYGRVWLSRLKKWMVDEGLDEKLAIGKIKTAVVPHGSIPLTDLQEAGSVQLHTADVMTALTNLLTSQIEQIVQAVQRQTQTGLNVFARQLAKLIGISFTENADECRSKLNEWIETRLKALEAIWPDSTMPVTTPFANQLFGDLEEAEFPHELSQLLQEKGRLLRRILVSKAAVMRWGKVPKSLARQRVMLSWALAQVTDKDEREWFAERLAVDELRQNLNVEWPYVGQWPNLDVPVILYSGKMTKGDREGQIQLFNELERAVLISTSAVEVGVDFDADVLITEACDGPSLLQRFGRIGRRAGVQGSVFLQLHDYAQNKALLDFLQEKLNLSREDFSTRINEIFPPRSYLEQSAVQDATHWQVNQRLGHIGTFLNEQMFTPEIEDLGRQMQTAGIELSYGLRSTLPQISLRGGITLDPFYALRIISSENLWPSESPFEMATVDMAYEHFIYQPSRWELEVDIEKTLKSGRALLIWHSGRWLVRSNPNIISDYWLFLNMPKQHWGPLQAFVSQNPNDPRSLKFDNVKPAIPYLTTDAGSFILGYGNVYLKRKDTKGESGTDDVTMYDGAPLLIPNQLWFSTLQKASQPSANENEEFNETMQFVDRDWGIVLEKIAGASATIYEQVLSSESNA